MGIELFDDGTLLIDPCIDKTDKDCIVEFGEPIAIRKSDIPRILDSLYWFDADTVEKWMTQKGSIDAETRHQRTE